jgi:hypothetical protein
MKQRLARRGKRNIGNNIRTTRPRASRVRELAVAAARAINRFARAREANGVEVRCFRAAAADVTNGWRSAKHGNHKSYRRKLNAPRWVFMTAHGSSS